MRRSQLISAMRHRHLLQSLPHHQSSSPPPSASSAVSFPEPTAVSLDQYHRSFSPPLSVNPPLSCSRSEPSHYQPLSERQSSLSVKFQISHRAVLRHWTISE